MHIQADRALIPARTPCVRHLFIQITAPGRRAPQRIRPAVHVALVLDRSGSMEGQKMDRAREAVTHAIKLLGPRDQLAVVVYDDRVDVLLRRTSASADAKQKASDRLAHIAARGSTNLSGGWFQGAEQVDVTERGRGDSSAVRRVLLLTDGLANRGTVDHDELAQAAREFRARGISTSTLGVGVDIDEDLLARLATEGGGHFYFIESAAQIPDLLASELHETLDIVARDVVFEIECGPAVDAMVLNSYATDAISGRLRVKLGDLVAEQEIALAVAVSCGPHPAGATAFVDCRVTDRDGALYQEPMRVEWLAAEMTTSGRQAVNEAVLVQAAEVIAERGRATALAANRRREYGEARRVIRDIIGHLQTFAPGNPHVDAIIERLRREEAQVGRAMDTVMLKARHYASYTAEHSRAADGRARRR